MHDLVMAELNEAVQCAHQRNENIKKNSSSSIAQRNVKLKQARRARPVIPRGVKAQLSLSSFDDDDSDNSEEDNGINAEFKKLMTDYYDSFIKNIKKAIATGKKGGQCCICPRPFIGFGNSAEPVKTGQCCDLCNATVIIPKRLALVNAATKSAAATAAVKN